MTTWSSGDLRDFFVAVQGHPCEFGFRLPAATGLRRGEVLGLRWRDVDFDLAQLSVANTITEIGAEVVMGPPKTAKSRRMVYLNRRTLAALREHRQRQRQQRLAAGPAWDSDHDWVLTDELGGYIRPQSMSYEWRVLMEKLDLPTMRLTSATPMRHRPPPVQRQVCIPRWCPSASATRRWASPSTWYSHVAPSLAKDAAEQIMSATYGDER